jgi:hypothetical protein
MNSNDNDTAVERQLGGHFARMRSEDSVDLPPFPDHPERAGHHGGDAAPGRRPPLLRISLAAAALLGVGILLTGRAPAEDPAALYAEIMGNYALETDELLSVSGSTSPGMTGLPELLPPVLTDDIDKLAN